MFIKYGGSRKHRSLLNARAHRGGHLQSYTAACGVSAAYLLGGEVLVVSEEGRDVGLQGPHLQEAAGRQQRRHPAPLHGRGSSGAYRIVREI